MAEGASDIPSPFDVRTIKYLVRLMGRFDLTEVDLREGDLRIRLRRGNKPAADGLTMIPAPTHVVPTAMPSGATPPPPTINPVSEAPARKLIEIKSPTPGTYYATPKPDADPFVKVGDKVQSDTVLCIIEAMKVFNEITADCNGTIVDVVLHNQQPVEYGQVLFRIDPSS